MNSFFYQANLIAGQPYTAPYGGIFFALWDAGEARKVDLQFVSGGQTSSKIPGMTAGFQVDEQFDAVVFSSPVNTVVQFFASQKPIKLGNKDGMRVSVPDGIKVTNDAGSRVPVDVGGGQINVTATNVVISNDNQNAIPVQLQRLSTIVDVQPVPLPNANQAYKISDDAALKRLRIRNAHDTAVIYIGGKDVTAANAALMLMPGDSWLEDDSPAAAWYAITDTAGAVVKIQGLK